MSKQNILYEKDFYNWTLKNSELLKKRQFSKLDIENIAEEIEAMGRNEKRELTTRLVILIQHLLKWKFQPNKRSNSWKLTIKNQRNELLDLLQESPSLKNKIDFLRAYEKGVTYAAQETGLAESDFPNTPCFSLDDCLNVDYFP